MYMLQKRSLIATTPKGVVYNCQAKHYLNDEDLEALKDIKIPNDSIPPQYLIKKQTVFQKIAMLVEKFKGVGGEIFNT